MSKSKCPICGTNLTGNHRTCPRCGSKVPPQIESQKAAPSKHTASKKKQTNTRSLKKGSLHTFILFGIVVAMVIILGVSLIFLLQGCSSSKPTAASAGFNEQVSADDYYNSISKVISVTPVSPSNVSTYEQSSQDMESRGLDQAPVEGMYSINGQILSGEEQITSQEQSPTYETHFTANDGTLWVIYEVGGQVMAYPAFYVLEHPEGRTVIVSEKESITGYDSETNCFFEIVPDPEYVLVIVVSEISAQTLSNLTAEVLDSYAN